VKNNVLGIRTIPVGSLARFSVCRRAVRSVVKLHKSCDLRINESDDVATAPTIAAVGPTEGLEFLAHYRCTAMPTVTALGVDCRLINECCHQLACLSVHEMKKGGSKWTRLPC
jgi:hypothetical protein